MYEFIWVIDIISLLKKKDINDVLSMNKVIITINPMKYNVEIVNFIDNENISFEANDVT